MLFLPAAALCCLCSAVVTVAAEELIQEGLTLTRRAEENVFFSCGGTEQCSSFVFWYQKKENETFKAILRINRRDGAVSSDFGHPQKDDFSAVNKQNGYVRLKIDNVKLAHSGTYYCSCYKAGKNSYYIFGSGTKLSVTEANLSGQKRTTQAPSIHVTTQRPPSGPRVHVDGNSSLLCVPPGMFPFLVQLSCRNQTRKGRLKELPPADGEQPELRESGPYSPILMTQEGSTYECDCYIKHRGKLQTQQDYVPSTFEVRSIYMLYTVLIVKSLVYCCGLSLLMILTNKGPSTNCTRAD
ncbi:uncharacterized protein LOC100700035 [Oreochromis niloticus]|uniref:uncharacterized protein LOC100700035 n=1 Tax=Oreochromis niloticus TaxID=8128 RepID=UPI000DF3742C|nr:uncharacterized protein LOC100700035 [Oreochromis niloticus]